MFVILAIIILIVSFTIALVSLVSEERKREKIETAKGEEIAPKIDEAKFPKIEPTAETDSKSSSRALFPWESTSEIESAGNEKVVEKSVSELSEAEIIEELSKVSSKDKEQTTEVNLPNVSRDEVPKRVVGEIKLEDLRKKP